MKREATVRLAALAIAAAAILVPFVIWGEAVDSTLSRFLTAEQSRPVIAAAVILLLTLDVLLPIPSSIVSVAAGTLLGYGVGILFVWTGMTAGCLFGYWIGARAGRLANDATSPPENLRGIWTLAVFRAVPVLAELSVLAAGFNRVRPATFLAITGSANLGIAVVYAWTGAFARDSGSFLLAFAAGILFPGILYSATRGSRLKAGGSRP